MHPMAKKKRGRPAGSGHDLTTTFSVRFDDETAARVDALSKKREKDRPGSLVSRGEITREAVLALLEREGF